uniref:hypothetical protein n=1 Tax=Ndongobacter massiliensis TaxID=1871025 RepID=UPI000930D944|nr:hypothetical protein [Ndongobacter massiliensis]
MKKDLRHFSLLLLLAVLLVGCVGGTSSGGVGKDNSKAKIEHYVITRYFGDDASVQDFIAAQKRENTCTDIYLNDEGYIEVEANEAQREQWMNRSRQVIDGLIAKRSMQEEGYTLRVNESADVFQVDGRKDLKIQELASDMTLILQNAEFYQIMNKMEDWSVNVSLYNHDTGEELMKIDFPEEDLNVDSELWD